MKNYFLSVLLLFIGINVSIAQERVLLQTKLSPLTQQYLLSLQNGSDSKRPQKDYVYNRANNMIYMSAIIKTNANAAITDFNTLGVHVGTQAGKIWTVQIPIENVSAFTKLKGIEYIELDEPVSVQMDSVRIATHVDSVHSGIDLPMPYTGKDVVVGVVDVGFDYTHPTLYDSLGNTYRVKKIWEQKKSGTAPSGFIYGNEITDSLSMRAAQTDNAANSHGMHVTGIAAGSGRKSSNTDNQKYKGMAFESEIVFVGIMPDSTEWQNTGVSGIVDGINYVYKYAASVGKPAVVNLSWGSPVGPRDGSSLFSQAVDALTGPGKIFVCSAGNDGDINLHLKKSFTATDTVVNTFVGFASYLNTKNTWVDIWGDAGKTFCAKVSLYKGVEGASTGYVCLDNNIHSFKLVGSNGDTCFVDMTTSTAEYNGKPRVYLSLGSRVPDSICLTIKSSSGDVNIWNGYVRDGGGYFGELTANGRPWATAGDADYTTTDFVATNSCVSVGAFSTRINFKNINNQSYSYSGYTALHKLIPFSSHGPSADGRIRPDITAPGLAVISSLSSFDVDYLPAGADYASTVASRGYDSLSSKYYYYGQFSGTSMSGPVASGVVALMLQAHPSLNPGQVKNILAQTALTDTFTGTLPVAGTNLWGHGKINAYQAVNAAALMPSGLFTMQGTWLNCILYPNPTSGKFRLDYTADKTKTLDVAILDISGKQILSTTWAIRAGNNSKSFDLAGFSKGVYFAKLSSGTEHWAGKVVVE